ncbi:unnamed protein product [Calypogeia fissa]
MATATAAVAESTGTRRAVVKSERFMEWQRELSSSRAIHGGRKRHEDTDTEAVNGMKKTYLKSEEDGEKPQGEHESDEREEGEERPADSNAGEGNGASHRIKRQKQLHQRQRSDVKKFRKEPEVDQRRVAPGQSKEKSPTPTEGDAGRMRRCKQQIGLPLQTSNPKRQTQPVTPVQQQPEGSLNQPISRRRQRRVPQSTSPAKEAKDIERVLRSLTRTRGGETPPTAPSVPAGKGTKRSKRVAQRLANEEPPPPPLKLPKLHLVLTRKEIQEDWVKITGHKYTGKPKKSTIVQRGLGLCTSLTCPSSIRYLNEPQ